MKLAAVLLALAVALLQLGSALADEAPELNIITTFPDNPFSLVQNGQANRVVFSIAKPAHLDRVLAIESITGAFLHPRKADGQSGRVLRNMSTLTLRSVPLHNVGGQPMQLPFDFYPEFKPQDMGVEFRMKVHDEQTNKVYDMELYRGTVTVQEPPFAFWDVQLLSVYVLFAALVAGAGYWAYKTYMPAKPRRKAPAQPQRQPADKKKGDAAPSSSGKKGDAKAPAYDEEWIPTHHLRPRKQRARRG